MVKNGFLFYGFIFLTVSLVSWHQYQGYQKKIWLKVANSYDVQKGMEKRLALKLMGIPDEINSNTPLADSTYIYYPSSENLATIKISFDSLERVMEVIYVENALTD